MKVRDWFMDETIDHVFVINDEISMRDDNFEERIQQLGGLALSNLQAAKLDSYSLSAPPSKTRRIGL